MVFADFVRGVLKSCAIGAGNCTTAERKRPEKKKNPGHRSGTGHEGRMKAREGLRVGGGET